MYTLRPYFKIFEMFCVTQGVSFDDTIFGFSNENLLFHYKLYFNEDIILCIYIENVDVPNLKFEHVVSQLFNFFYEG